MREEIFNSLTKEKRRLFSLTALAIVVALWCMTLPPVLNTDPILQPKAQSVDSTDVEQFYSLNNQDDIDFHVWDLKEIKPEQEKTKVINMKPLKEIKVEKVVPLKPKVITEVPVQHIPIVPVVTQSSLPNVKYLGQIIDSAGLQIFLSFDNTNVVMRPQIIYDNIWKVISVDDREVRLEYVPTKQIINVSKII